MLLPCITATIRHAHCFGCIGLRGFVQFPLLVDHLPVAQRPLRDQFEQKLSSVIQGVHASDRPLSDTMSDPPKSAPAHTYFRVVRLNADGTRRVVIHCLRREWAERVARTLSAQFPTSTYIIEPDK